MIDLQYLTAFELILFHERALARCPPSWTFRPDIVTFARAYQQLTIANLACRLVVTLTSATSASAVPAQQTLGGEPTLMPWAIGLGADARGETPANRWR